MRAVAQSPLVRRELVSDERAPNAAERSRRAFAVIVETEIAVKKTTLQISVEDM
jgi:hypothetical protein